MRDVVTHCPKVVITSLVIVKTNDSRFKIQLWRTFTSFRFTFVRCRFIRIPTSSNLSRLSKMKDNFFVYLKYLFWKITSSKDWTRTKGSKVLLGIGGGRVLSRLVQTPRLDKAAILDQSQEYSKYFIQINHIQGVHNTILRAPWTPI